YLLQWIGLPIGEFLTDLSTGLIEATPLLGGVFVTLVGFGFLVGDRKREKKKKKNKRKWKEEEFEVHGSEFTRSKPSSGAQGNPTTSSSSRLGNDLDRDDTDDFSSYSQGSSYGSSSGTGSYEPYGYRHSKKLNKSRTDKKISGVCGGLARYFGVSSTVVRIIFVAAFFMGYGTSLLIYLGLALAMPKEPVDYMDDYNF
ncbi:MAG: PspC domain-containing protein, partial [Bacteroidota bacterium]